MPLSEATYDLFKCELPAPADVPTPVVLPEPRFRQWPGSVVTLPIRYLVFSGLEYAPGGGWRDFKVGCATELTALAIAEEIHSEHWVQVVDLQRMWIIYQRHVPWGSPTYNYHGPQCR